tara:strand:+ start:247 stop:459 length:213 start_codon:yes stop_codon:yes gene_type:complete
MKNLLQRLKPEIVKNLYNQEKEFPRLVGDLLKILSSEVAITNMKFGDLSNLGNFCENSPNTVLEFYEMFD